MKRTAACLLIMIIVLCGSALAEEAAVRVNEKVYTVSEVQKYIDETAVNMSMMLGIDIADIYDADSREEFLTEAAEHFVTVELMNEKLRELGMLDISEEEEDALREFAQVKFDEIWMGLNERIEEAYPGLEDRERYVTQLVESAGYSMDGIYGQALQALRQQRLIDLYCTDIEVSDEETEAYYEENFVAPDREKYEGDIDAFESEVLLGGGSSSYVPVGYFYIKYIVLEPKEASEDAVYSAEIKAAECAAARENAYNALAVGALENGDLDALRTAYQTALGEETCALEALDEAAAAAERDYLPIWQVVRDALVAGETFEEQMLKFSIDTDMAQDIDTGYPFHPVSRIWDTRLSESVSTLTSEGEITMPIYASGRIYIVCRMQDLPEGAYPLDAEAREELRQGILLDKQAERLDELAAEWRKDAEVEIDISGLVFPLY